MALQGGGLSSEQLPEPWAARVGTTHPSATKKKISGRSKGTSTRKLVLKREVMVSAGRGGGVTLTPQPWPLLPAQLCPFYPLGPILPAQYRSAPSSPPRRSWGWKRRERGEGRMGRRGGRCG